MVHEAERCPFCGRAAGYVYVTSHYQCAACGQVVEPCCTGEQAQVGPASCRSPVAPTPVAPGATRPRRGIDP
jgi:hypothetical protein